MVICYNLGLILDSSSRCSLIIYPNLFLTSFSKFKLGFVPSFSSKPSSAPRFLPIDPTTCLLILSTIILSNHLINGQTLNTLLKWILLPLNPLLLNRSLLLLPLLYQVYLLRKCPTLNLPLFCAEIYHFEIDFLIISFLYVPLKNDILKINIT